MLGRRSAWGIDIGESTIRAVRLVVNNGQARIAALDTVRRPRGASPGGYSDRDEQLRAVLSQFLAQNALGGDAVAISPPGAGFDRFIQLPPVEKRRIPQIVSYEARQQIPFPLDQVVWDYQCVSENPAPGQEIEVGLFAFRAEVVESFLSNLSQVNLGVDMIGMGRLALYNFIAYDRRPEAGTMVVDFGASSTDVIIIHQGNFRVRSIPFAGDTVTKALQNKFGISFEEAEDLKRKAAQSKQFDKLMSVMRPTLEKIVGQVTQTVGFFRQQFRDLKIENCWLVGDGFKLPGVTDMFKQSLEGDVALLGDLNTVALGEEVLTSPYRTDLSAFGTAMGLALQALGQGPVRINLLPRPELFRREVCRKKPCAAVALAGIAAILGTLYWTASRDAKAWPSLQESLKAEIKAIDAKVSERRKIEGRAVAISKQLVESAKVGQGRTAILDAINKVARVFNEPKAADAAPAEDAAAEEVVTAGAARGLAEGLYETQEIFLTEFTAVVVSSSGRETDFEQLRLARRDVPREGAAIHFTLSGETELEVYPYVEDGLVKPLQELFKNADPKPEITDRKFGVEGGEEAKRDRRGNTFEITWGIPLVGPDEPDSPGEAEGGVE